MKSSIYCLCLRFNKKSKLKHISPHNNFSMISQHFHISNLNKLECVQDEISPTKAPLSTLTLPTHHQIPNHKPHQHYAGQTYQKHKGQHHHHDHDHYMQEHIQKYLDMQSLHPDWKFAHQHGHSTKPGLNKDRDERAECICCLRRVDKKPIALCQNSKELQFLGYGFPLYFIFLKYSIIILLIEIINFSVAQLYLAITQNYDFCINGVHKIVNEEEIHCTSFIVLLADIAEEITDVETTLRVTSFVTLLLCLIYVRDTFTKTWMYYDERETSYADFSVIIENLPRKKDLGNSQLTIGKRLRNFFNDKHIFSQKLKIAKVNLIGQLTEFEQLEHQRKQLTHQLANLLRQNHEKQLQQKKVHPQGKTKGSGKNKEKKELKSKLKQVEKKIMQEKRRLKNVILKEDVDCDKAIVCFETEDEMLHVEKVSQSLTEEELKKHFGDHASQITIEQSPQPQEINWQFINIPETTHIRRTFISWILFISMLGAITAVVYFLFSYKSHEVSKISSDMGAIIVILSLLGIIFFNKFVMSYAIHHLVEFQMHKTGESAQFSFMLKYSLGLFFTTALMTILVEGVTHDNVYTEHYGIVQEETIMFFFNAFLVPLIWLINPWYIWKTIQRKLHQNSPYMTQEDANKLMEDPQYLMGKRYGEVLESLWFTFLYSGVIPFGSILIFIGLILYYWVDKYNLLRKSSILQGVSGNLCMKALFLMQFTLILKPGGELIFDALIRHTWTGVAVLQISIGMIYLMLPMKNILEHFHPQKFLSSESTYSQLKQSNILSYELYHPLTKQEQLKKHFQKIEGSQLPENQRHQQRIASNVSIERHLIKKHSFVRPHKPKARVNDTEESLVSQHGQNDNTFSKL